MGFDLGSVIRVVMVTRDIGGVTKDPTVVTINARTPDTGVTIVGTPLQDPTTIAAASNGLTLPQSTISVAYLPPYLPSQTVLSGGLSPTNTATVVTSAGTQLVTYTGFTSTSLTGCSGGTGTMSTGGTVIPIGVWHADFTPASTASGVWDTHGTGTGAINVAQHGFFVMNVPALP